MRETRVLYGFSRLFPDANKDKDITNGELLAYMDQNVPQKASELGHQQNTSLAGDPDKILMSYR